jgi:hypothetical protein
MTCAFITTSSFGAVGCCDNSDCGMHVTCLDLGQIISELACDDACFFDTMTLKWYGIRLPLGDKGSDQPLAPAILAHTAAL